VERQRFVPLVVVIELVWVLASCYGRAAAKNCMALIV
jgi:predicted nucleic-acid-binding protein